MTHTINVDKKLWKTEEVRGELFAVVKRRKDGVEGLFNWEEEAISNIKPTALGNSKTISSTNGMYKHNSMNW